MTEIDLDEAQSQTAAALLKLTGLTRVDLGNVATRACRAGVGNSIRLGRVRLAVRKVDSSRVLLAGPDGSPFVLSR